MLPQLLLPVLVALGPGCAEGSILPRGVGVVKVAKAIEYLGVGTRGKRGRNKFSCTIGISDLYFPDLLFCAYQVCRYSPTSEFLIEWCAPVPYHADRAERFEKSLAWAVNFIRLFKHNIITSMILEYVLSDSERGQELHAWQTESREGSRKCRSHHPMGYRSSRLSSSLAILLDNPAKVGLTLVRIFLNLPNHRRLSCLFKLWRMGVLPALLLARLP